MSTTDTIETLSKKIVTLGQLIMILKRDMDNMKSTIDNMRVVKSKPVNTHKPTQFEYEDDDMVINNRRRQAHERYGDGTFVTS